MSACNDVTFCGDCNRKLDGPYRCDCTYHAEPMLSVPARVWRVIREGVPQMPLAGMPHLSRSMAVAYAEANGGTLTDPDGRVVGAWPVPEWYRRIERKAAEVRPERRPGDAEVAA